MGIGFYKADILIPKTDLATWSVVACDQHSSDPAYWETVRRKTEGKPSSRHIIFPEAELGKVDFARKVASINATMQAYLDEDLFDIHRNCLIYVERTLSDGSIRKGLLGVLDLEQYDYNKGSGSPVRATEGTVPERIAPRVAIRENAPLEIPHILVLIDDEEKHIVEQFHARTHELHKLYDVDLMLGGGAVRGYRLTDSDYESVAEGLRRLADPQGFAERYGVKDQPVLLYAMGDGNHSLATAKACYTALKERLGDRAQAHPARYALVELGNLHDDSLRFEPIHRVVFDADQAVLLKEFESFAAHADGPFKEQVVRVVTRQGERTYRIPHPTGNLTVGTVQTFLDQYLSRHPGRVDYVHGEEAARTTAAQGAAAFLLDCLPKNELFRTVILEGALPRKSFSMGEANEKRYYLECRKLG